MRVKFKYRNKIFVQEIIFVAKYDENSICFQGHNCKGIEYKVVCKNDLVNPDDILETLFTKGYYSFLNDNIQLYYYDIDACKNGIWKKFEEE